MVRLTNGQFRAVLVLVSAVYLHAATARADDTDGALLCSCYCFRSAAGGGDNIPTSAGNYIWVIGAANTDEQCRQNEDRVCRQRESGQQGRLRDCELAVIEALSDGELEFADEIFDAPFTDNAGEPGDTSEEPATDDYGTTETGVLVEEPGSGSGGSELGSESLGELVDVQAQTDPEPEPATEEDGALYEQPPVDE